MMERRSVGKAQVNAYHEAVGAQVVHGTRFERLLLRAGRCGSNGSRVPCGRPGETALLVS